MRPFNIDKVTYDLLKKYRLSVGAPWFTKPWDINLIIARSDKTGSWDDWVFMCCVDDTGMEIVLKIRATGDAWDGEWTNPTHPDGCVYVLDQHVPGGYTIGLHKGRPALTQVKPFTNVRWPKSKGFVPSVKDLEDHAKRGNSFVGTRGTNLHNRWNNSTPSKPAPDDSEGCIVVLYQHEYAAMLKLAEIQKIKTGAATFSPTFCKLKDL